ncbi:hypothetical protein DTO166G4_2009 [Paecilomyces variotii]|uniref:GPI anchored serine-threonine rich protein n=1 Tax=Byssochlamys spectabilis TaxID=264951 RepID=A0A443I375_BYSSP|nr:GPI anchored serine-threonine rich protein [Paecilomyces variotii]KAJ9191472.1 hypothetical protein DTO164E3_8816 [Paecilomyces variotii]KAJ9216421.1 hypothetical protein DTO166G4_2009 [Paecilomyces variotii]KAJ9224931.1 hypothetical protein DTO169C6_2851 [Paecilomyces variotii]KAJ9227791.1 hypothetical protein DTO166G5_9140 [Paecilomyces variotii]KAJ9246233.1 hypothetical protein DTO207G8_9149 [Paecilomyces variotii]
MRFFAISILSALAATVSAATTPDYSQGPSGNPIALPGLNDQVPVGQPYQIKWQPTTPGDVSIWLLRGPSSNVQPIATLASNIPNSGEFTWTPSTSLQDDVTHYGLIIIVEGTGQYQYSTQFGIKNDAVAAGTTSAAVAPTSAAAVKTTAAPVTSSSSSVAVAVESTTASSTETTEATVKTAIKSITTSSAPAETTQTTAATPAIPPSNSAAASPSTVTQAASSSTPVTPTTFSSSSITTPTNRQSSSPTPTYTGGADRKTAGFGAIAVAAGLMAVFAF